MRVVVALEAARETEAPVQHVGGDERRRRVARGLQQGGQRGRVRREDVAAVVVHAVMRRLEPAEDRRVRRQGQGHGGERFLEHDPRAASASSCGVAPAFAP